MRRLAALLLLCACGHDEPKELGLGPPPPPETPSRKAPPPRLEYPADALGRGAQGDVTVKVCLDEAGRVQRVKVLKDEPRLGRYVEEVVSSWRLPPPPEGPCFERNFRFRIQPTDAELEACDGGALVAPEYEAPRRMRSAAPPYPAHLKQRGVEGDVVLLVHLDADGDVAKAEVLATPHRDLGAPAVEAVRAWQWAPATLRGRPVRSCLPVRLEFRLQRGAKPDPV